MSSPARKFFQEVSRLVPAIVKQYNLNELTTAAELRSNINVLFKKNAAVTNPQAVQMLVYKGREELLIVTKHHKQRHHMITQYVAPFRQEVTFDVKPNTNSAFLDKFYTSNA